MFLCHNSNIIYVSGLVTEFLLGIGEDRLNYR